MMAPTTNSIVKRADVEGLLLQCRDRMTELLPKTLTPERMIRLSIMAATNPALRQCTAMSIVQCCMDCAQLGLEPANGMAYLVPFKDTAVLIIGYRGLLDIAHRSGNLRSVVAEVVYENDDFQYTLGDNPSIRHVPESYPATRGEMIGAYAILDLPTGAKIRCYMDASEIEAVRSSSRGSDKPGSPWGGPFAAEMWRKTALRRAMKLVPRSLAPELFDAASIEDESSGIVVEAAKPLMRPQAKQTAVPAPATPPTMDIDGPPITEPEPDSEPPTQIVEPFDAVEPTTAPEPPKPKPPKAEKAATLITEEDRRKLWDISKETGVSQAAMTARAKEMGFATTKALTVEAFGQLCEWMRSQKTEQPSNSTSTQTSTDTSSDRIPF